MDTEFKKIRFDTQNKDAFYIELNKRVRKYFKDKGTTPHANWKLWLKMGIFFAIMGGSYALILLQVVPPWGMLGLGIVFTVSALLIGINLGHDAGHKAVSKKAGVNKFLSRIYDIVGISSYFWDIKHNGSHHRFTNVPEYDADITQVKLLRISPSTKIKPWHRYQHLYAPFLYGIFTIFLVFIKDFTMLFSKRIGSEANLHHPTKEVILLILSKLFYTGYALVIPILVLDISAGWVVLGFVLSHVVASIIAMMILLPVHAIDQSIFSEPNEEGVIPRTWAMHQVAVCQDFATSNGVAGWFFGGLNFHMVHHLFPAICHVHFQDLTKILKETTKDFGLTYISNSWPGAIKKHFIFLKKMGRDENAYLVE